MGVLVIIIIVPYKLTNVCSKAKVCKQEINLYKVYFQLLAQGVAKIHVQLILPYFNKIRFIARIDR